MAAESPYTLDDLAVSGLCRERLPRHIAIIMDGNGRWAQNRGLPRIEGHRRGVESVREIVEESARLNLVQLTLFCFSSENWKRPRPELDLLMSLLQRFVVAERENLMSQNIRFTTIGRNDRISSGILREVEKTCKLTAANTGLQLCLALDYGARDEIVTAVQQIAQKVQSGELSPEAINEATISDHLFTRQMIDPDLVIRTSGEMRISNFLLWQISYAELFVTDTAWPEFRREHLFAALKDYASRDRRFGGLKTK